MTLVNDHFECHSARDAEEAVVVVGGEVAVARGHVGPADHRARHRVRHRTRRLAGALTGPAWLPPGRSLRRPHPRRPPPGRTGLTPPPEATHHGRRGSRRRLWDSRPDLPVLPGRLHDLAKKIWNSNSPSPETDSTA